MNNDFGQAQSSAALATNTAPDDIFFIDVPACATLTIQMTASSFDNATALRRGGSCPGTIQISSFDPDLSTHTYVNTASTPERVWYIVDGWGTGTGTYTFNWSISTACQTPQALVSTPVGTGANASWTSCTSAVGYEWQLQTPVGAQGTNVVQSGSGTTPTTLAISGLASLTPYRLWVRNDCGSGNFSAWVSVDFTSLCAGTPTAGTITPATASQCLNGPNQTFTSAGQSAGAGFVYQWQQSPDGVGSWTNVPGATTANLVIQATQLVRYYRQVTTCTGSGLTAISNVVQLNGTTGVGCSAAYGVTRNASATYTPLFPAGTAFTWQGTPTNGDDVSSQSVTIPFTFNYFGVNYTTFRVNTNGFMSLGGTLTGTNFTNDIGTNTATRNAVIAPLWDDLITPGNTVASLSFVSYSITGASPDRVLTVEWAGMEKFNYAGPNMNFQVRLYETTNVIEFVYGSMTMHNGTSNSLNAPTTYSLGINSATTGAQSITNLVAQQQFNTNIFGGLAQNGLTVVPECNTSITFTPGGSIGVGTPLPAITNDEPAGALSLTVGSSSPAEYCGWNRSTGATASAGIPVCGDPAPGVADDDVWFTFNNPTTQNIRVSVVPEVFYNAVVQVFSDAGVTSIACSNTAGVSFTENVNFTNLAPGNYWVRVYDAATGVSAGGHFHISVFNPPPVPANDNPQAAIALATSTTCTPISGTSLGATAGDPAGTPPTGTTAIPATGNGGIDDDVWYSFVPTTTSAEIRVQSGTGYNAAFQLYDGGVAPGTFTAAIPAVGGEINATSTLGLESNLYTTLIPGNTYFVRVYHVSVGSGPTGSFTICRRDVCPGVTTFAATANNATLEANFSWTGGNIDVYYGATPLTAPIASTPATQANITSPAVITGLAINTTYQVWYRSNCGSGFVGDWVGPVTYFTGYCPPTGGTVYGITNVTTTGGTVNFNNTSGIGGVAGSGYQNYSSTIGVSNYEGNPTTISIATSGSDDFFYVWIDWNGDFDFADANETIAATTTFAATFTGTINIPASTPVGAYRMRVANSWSGAITPCGPGANSEYEDYTFNVVPVPTCFAPTGVTASINSTTSATISWTAATPAPASGYQYFVATSTTPPTAATTPTGTTAAGVLTASLTGLLAETNYNVWVRSNCGAGDISAWSSPAAFFTGYCQFTHTQTSDRISSFVTTGGNDNINNVTAGTAAYENFVAQAVTGFEGQTINFTATYVGGAAGFSVWVDWNNNLTFETSERVYNAPATASTHTGSFAIPTPQAFGNYRMRIAAWWNNLSPAPCGVVGYGQAEDYTLTVLEPITCLTNAGPGTITGPSNICPGVSFTLTSSVETIGTEYIWQRRTGATWVTIPAATTQTITVSQTVATEYRVRIGCSLDNTTATSPSNVVAVAMNPFNQCYCASSYTFGTTDNDGISNVTLGSINNNSGLAPTPFISTFAPGVGTTTTLAQGAEASGSVTVASTFGDLSVAVWIDYNRNGAYEASERVTQSTATLNGGNTHPFTFVVPPTALAGTTGMRVRTVYLVADVNACDLYGYGETENYTVTIVPGSANDARVNAQPVSPAVFPGCSNISGNLANATPSQAVAGNDLWYRFTATSNAVRIQLTGAQDCEIELQNAAGTALDVEDATTANGNEVLAFGGLVPGTQYWVAVRSQNATPSNFTCCIQSLNDSRCDSGPNFSSLCNTFKVDWTGTPNYVARFTQTTAPFSTFTANLPNATSIPLRNIAGLQHNRSYSVAVDAIYTVVDAAGNPSTITATSNETCIINIAQHPLTNLRSLDRDPATRAIGAFISADLNVCSVTDWEWTFELVDNAGVPTSLDGPISVLAGSTSRFIRTSQIPNVAPGNRYRVRVRPIFASGPGVFDDASFHYLRIASSAGIAEVFDNTVNPEQVYFERNTENGVFAALYPNPNNGDMVNLNLAGIDSDNVNVRIMDASGRIVWTNRFVVDGALNTIIAFDRPLTSGIYLVEMTYDNEVITERMMVTK